MSNLLECTALTKRYSQTVALDGFTAGFAAGHITGLLGPNGSGKTTLMKLACGLLAPDGGTVTIQGKQPGVQTKAITSYLPERPCMPTDLRVRETVAMFADFYEDFRTEKANAMLADLSIDANLKISQLSKGTREKMQLILAMSREAKLYLLDEPIGGVDPAARDYILGTIVRNYAPEAALVISTHLISDVENILDDVVMIQNGRLRMAGSADDLRAEHGKSVDALFREVFKC